MFSNTYQGNSGSPVETNQAMETQANFMVWRLNVCNQHTKLPFYVIVNNLSIVFRHIERAAVKNGIRDIFEVGVRFVCMYKR